MMINYDGLIFRKKQKTALLCKVEMKTKFLSPVQPMHIIISYNYIMYSHPVQGHLSLYSPHPVQGHLSI